jgi:multiple sugar transport system substrate-binding protein
MEKRIFLSVFAILLVVSLAACGPAQTAVPVATEKPAATDAAKATEAPKAAEVPAEAVEITFMAWGAPEELAVWQQIADEFHAANPNITVKMDVSEWDSYWTKLDTLFAGGTPPDVFAMDAPLFLDWQSRGVLLNLQPYIDATPGFLDGFYEQTLSGYKLADGYYGLPRDFQTIVMYYNKDMFDAAGVEYPKEGWTWQDLREMAKKLTVDKNGDGKTDQYGYSCDLWDMELCWSEAIWAYGGDVISSDYTQTLIGEPKAREAWKLFYDMTFVDKSMPDTVAAGEYGYDLLQAGMVAMWPHGHWSMPAYKDVEFQWDVAPMPTGPAGQATSVNSAGFVIAKDSKHPDAAWEFVKFAVSQTGQTRLTELGLAIPVLKSVAESPVFLEQDVNGRTINQKIFLDSLEYAHLKPIFKGYTEWSSAIGDGMADIWAGEAELDATLDKVVADADAVLAEQKQ